MLFNSYQYLIFLPLVWLLYWHVFKPLRWQNLFLLAASYVFYGWWNWRFLILIAITSACSYARSTITSLWRAPKKYWPSLGYTWTGPPLT